MAKSEEANMNEYNDPRQEQNDDEIMIHCPEDCGKKTFCHKGEPLPEDKTECYTQSIICPICGLMKYYMVNGHAKEIPHPKSTEQYWKGKVCICPT
jgi:hypothetical protein